MKIFTKSVLAFVALLAAGVANAQQVQPTYVGESLPVTGSVHEWRATDDTQFQGAANMEGDAYVVTVRSEQEARDARNATMQNGRFADYDSQFFIDFSTAPALERGQKVRVIFQAKADVATTGIATQSHTAFTPGTSSYLHSFGIGTLDFETYWQYFDTGVMTVSNNNNSAPRTGAKAFALNLAKGGANKYYFRNILVLVGDDVNDVEVTWPEAPEGKMYDNSFLVHTGNPTTNHWNQHVVCNLPEALVPDAEYTLKMSLKAANPAEGRGVEAVSQGVQEDWYGHDAQTDVTGEFAEYSWTFTAKYANTQIGISCGQIDGDLYIDNVSLKKKGSDEELIPDGTFSEDGETYWTITTHGRNIPTPDTEIYRTFIRDLNYIAATFDLPDTDPAIISAKAALLTAINKAKNTELLGKTTASKKVLADAIAAGEALIAAEGGVVADIDAAREAVLNATYGLEDRTAPTAEKEVPKGWKSVITNGNLEGKDMSCFSAKVADAKDATECETADYEGIDDFHALFVQSNAAIKTQDWSDQLFITATETIPAGTKIHVEFDYRSDVEATAETQSHNLAGQYIHYAAIGNVNFKPEWQHFNYDGAVVAECNGGDNNGGYKNDFRTIAFNLSKNGKNTKFFIDNVVFWIELPKVQKQVLENGDLEGEETSNYMVKVYPSSAIVPATLTEGAGKDGSKGIKIDAPKKVSQDWDSQFWIQLPYESVPAGTSIKVKFDYKASAAASVDTQTHEAPGNYIHYAAIGTLNFTTDWKTFEGTFAVPSQCDGSDNSNGYKNNFRSIAFNLAKGTANDDVTFYFDNFSMTMDEEVADELTVVTGIKNVQPAAVKAGQYYDLLGRPVAQPRKGLYILNGQKVAVK